MGALAGDVDGEARVLADKARGEGDVVVSGVEDHPIAVEGLRRALEPSKAHQGPARPSLVPLQEHEASAGRRPSLPMSFQGGEIETPRDRQYREHLAAQAPGPRQGHVPLALARVI